MGLFRSSEFASGTRVLFQQSTAPVGWTKDATHNDKSLRVVSGAVGSGGSVAFSTFAAQSIGATTLSVAQMPSHQHILPQYGGWLFGSGSLGSGYTIPNMDQAVSGASSNGQLDKATGGGGSHTHSLNMALQYVDAIICAKN